MNRASRLTCGELYRRRVETAGQIAAVSDGAEWIAGFVALHCPEAVRIVDFPHAAQRVCQIGEAVLGREHAALAAWQTHQLHQLAHAGAQEVRQNVRSFAAAHLRLPVVAEKLADLDKREAQMHYPTFQESDPTGPFTPGTAPAPHIQRREMRV